MSAAVTIEPYRTTDLALATFLSLNGQSFQLEGGGDRASFVFSPVTDDERLALDELVAKFGRGHARVEPMKFMREVGQVRGRLYDFLDGARPQRA